MRAPHWYFSELNPWMTWVKVMAKAVRQNRRPAFRHDVFAQRERSPSRQFKPSLDVGREAYDSGRFARYVSESSCA
jgi:hypothetical protein